MLLGFISLLLTVGTTYVAKICVPKRLGNTWLPCDKGDDGAGAGDGDGDGGGDDDDKGRKLLSYGQQMLWRRALASKTDQYDYCSSKVIFQN